MNNYIKCSDCDNEIFETRVYECFTCKSEVCANCVEVAGSHDLCSKCSASDFVDFNINKGELIWND